MDLADDAAPTNQRVLRAPTDPPAKLVPAGR
jgi:hypothetical protein